MQFAGAKYGVTETGFVKPRMSDLRSYITERLRDYYQKAGYSGELQTRPDSIFGIMIDETSERMSEVWDMAEAVYNAMYPSTAIGVNLDRAVSFSPIIRFSDEKSQCYVIYYGVEGSVIPEGAQIRNIKSGELWKTTSRVDITRGSASDVMLLVTAASNSTYVVTIDNAFYQYRSGSLATTSQIVAGLIGALSSSGLIITGQNDRIRLRTDGSYAFSINAGTNIKLENIGSSSLAETVEAVSEIAEIGDLTEMVTRISGVESVNNVQTGAPGRKVETDAELRKRYHDTGVYSLGAATVNTIRANLMSNVIGVTKVKVFENPTDVIDSVGRPPHSIHVVVVGGLNDLIAKEIKRVKAAGIDTFGATTVNVEAGGGSNMPIKFDRPKPVYVWVKAQITQLPGNEQIFPADGVVQIKEAIYKKGVAQDIGDDVILQSYFCAFYQTSGVASVRLKMAHSRDASHVPNDGEYSEGNITIADYEQAIFDLSRIEVA